MSENTWPNGERRAISQSEHERHNAMTFPGTRQMCRYCDEPTGNSEPGIFVGDYGPICADCVDIVEEGIGENALSAWHSMRD